MQFWVKAKQRVLGLHFAICFFSCSCVPAGYDKNCWNFFFALKKKINERRLSEERKGWVKSLPKDLLMWLANLLRGEPAGKRSHWRLDFCHSQDFLLPFHWSFSLRPEILTAETRHSKILPVTCQAVIGSRRQWTEVVRCHLLREKYFSQKRDPSSFPRFHLWF